MADTRFAHVSKLVIINSTLCNAETATWCECECSPSTRECFSLTVWALPTFNIFASASVLARTSFGCGFINRIGIRTDPPGYSPFVEKHSQSSYMYSGSGKTAGISHNHQFWRLLRCALKQYMVVSYFPSNLFLCNSSFAPLSFVVPTIGADWKSSKTSLRIVTGENGQTDDADGRDMDKRKRKREHKGIVSLYSNHRRIVIAVLVLVLVVPLAIKWPPATAPRADRRRTAFTVRAFVTSRRQTND